LLKPEDEQIEEVAQLTAIASHFIVSASK